MDTLEFLCDRRFHRNYILPPDPETGRDKPYRFSYSDFGDRDSKAVVLFCGALFGTRLCYAPLDQLAHANKVRIIHADRPGIGGSDPVELEKRVQIWLEMVPRLLNYLGIAHVSLASHSGGVIYLLNTMLTYPHLLHPKKPYVSLFAPWVHPSHSKVTQMQVTELLPALMIGKFASVARFVQENVMPLARLSGGIAQGVKTSFLRPSLHLAPVPLAPIATNARAPSTNSHQGYPGPALDDPKVIDELRKYITTFVFAECTDGISADAQLFLRKPRSIPWCAPSLFWSDIDYFVPLFSKLVDEDVRIESHDRKWTIDAFHAEDDNMVGEKGRHWFDNCWLPDQTATSNAASDLPQDLHENTYKSYEYRSTVVESTDHNFLMDPVYGASEIWLQRVKDSFLQPVEEEPAGSIVVYAPSIQDVKNKSIRGFMERVKHLTRVISLRPPLPQPRLSQPVLVVSSRLGRQCSSADDKIDFFSTPMTRWREREKVVDHCR